MGLGGCYRLEAACLHALSRIATAITAARGRLPADKDLLAELAVTLVCNEHGSEVIGEAIDPFFQEAVSREGFRPLPPQERPVVMNVKGASASGKSTMRPLQKQLAARLGVSWADFALISPDIWRKYLLDYGSLGQDALLRVRFPADVPGAVPIRCPTRLL